MAYVHCTLSAVSKINQAVLVQTPTCCFARCFGLFNFMTFIFFRDKLLKDYLTIYFLVYFLTVCTITTPIIITVTLERNTAARYVLLIFLLLYFFIVFFLFCGLFKRTSDIADAFNFNLLEKTVTKFF